jgi:nucleotide-binding universal stress UspA family protein
MYDRILVAIDASPDSPDDSLNRTTQFAKMTGGTVHLLHVARGHLVPTDISAGAGLGVRSPEDDADLRERQVVQNAVDQLAAAGINVHGEMIEATEHDVADVIVQRRPTGQGARRRHHRAGLPAPPRIGGGPARHPPAAALLDPAGPAPGVAPAMSGVPAVQSRTSVPTLGEPTAWSC